MSEEKKKFQYLDSLSNPQEIEIGKEDFTFVKNEKRVFEQKRKGKPVTFFKDAMKRFVKSKPAVAGGSILGLIILGAIFIPICMPNYGCYDVSTTHLLNPDGIASEKALPPKLFDNANGFWDGTIKKENVPYDMDNKTPSGFEMRTVRDGSLDLTEYYVDQTGTYGKGGYINLTNFDTNTSKIIDYYSYKYSFDFTYDYSITYRFVKPYDESYKAGQYRISLITKDSAGNKTYYPLTGSDTSFNVFTDATETYTNFVDVKYSKDEEGNETLNVSDIMKSKYGLTNLDDASINIDVLNESTESKRSDILIENLNITTTDTNTDDDITKRSIVDANNNIIQEQKINKTGTITRIDNPAYWTGKNFSRTPLNVKFAKATFLYDPYEDCYGVKTITITSYKMTQWINNGYIKYNPLEGISSYESLDNSNNPIVKVISQEGEPKYSKIDKGYSGYTVTCEISQYKYLGYPSKPKYLLGTDNYGRDYLKTTAQSLRLSLLIAFGCAAINIIIGVIWGSISGYFGGWTDIVMERICDIVSGLPSIAIITLCLLHLHNDMLAFIISMFLTGWMGVASRTRTQFYRYKGREYVLASRTLGAKSPRLIFRHILPNSLGTIITSSILMIPSVIYSEASIAYLGLGLKNELLFGVILYENSSIFEGYTIYLLIIPTVIMAFLLVSFNLFGNGLRDAFNPSLKGGE